MKIIAISDLHGNLINIKEKCDVVIIAGDLSPLYCQHDYYLTFDWINLQFMPWMLKLNTNHVIFIPGNHDIVCENKNFNKELRLLLHQYNAVSKIHYLCNNSVTINKVKFYGTPNNESPRGWAFAKQYNQNYKFDTDTNILITHQPPKIGNVGYVPLYHRELGSSLLRDKILDSNIDINICGHIHTGEHGETPVILNNGKFARIYNVSILDEEYSIAYKPTIIEL